MKTDSIIAAMFLFLSTATYANSDDKTIETFERLGANLRLIEHIDYLDGASEDELHSDRFLSILSTGEYTIRNFLIRTNPDLGQEILAIERDRMSLLSDEEFNAYLEQYGYLHGTKK